jgi:hypothetical protein
MQIGWHRKPQQILGNCKTFCTSLGQSARFFAKKGATAASLNSFAPPLPADGPSFSEEKWCA